MNTHQNKIVNQPFHRHRRRSNPSSPTSPIQPRRISDRPTRAFDRVSPAEGISVTTGLSDSPSLGVEIPSPTFDLTQSASPILVPRSSTTEHKTPLRLSEDDGRPKRKPLLDPVRPATSDAVDATHAHPESFNLSQAADPTSKSSPLTTNRTSGDYRERRSYETPTRPADRPSPHLRQYSASPQTPDRGFLDDHGSAKLNQTKKSRLNLLNPMTLLARRRSSQNTNDYTNLTVTTRTVPALPNNFDPSIRGTITHDFSAPRTRRTPSYGDSSSYEPSPRRDGYQAQDNSSPRIQPPANHGANHSPMFREHFQDDHQTVHPEQTSYLQNIAASVAADTAQLAASMPVFAKRLPVKLPGETGGIDSKPEAIGLNRDQGPVKDVQSSVPVSKSSPTFETPGSSVLPKHMKSTSSRFSFQLNEHTSSTQEKMLEAKHKEQQSTMLINQTTPDDDLDDENYDDYDDDADFGLEEQIPGVNTDLEDDADNFEPYRAPIDMPTSSKYDHQMMPEPDIKSLQQLSLNDFHFSPQASTLSPLSAQEGSQTTPRDYNGDVIGLANTKDSPQNQTHHVVQNKKSSTGSNEEHSYNGLGIKTSVGLAKNQISNAQQRGGGFDDTDMYFDDGEFDGEVIEDTSDHFDETVFDNTAGKIRDIPAENAKKFEAAVQAAGLDGKVKLIGHNTNGIAEWNKAVAKVDGLGSQDNVKSKGLRFAEPPNGDISVTGLTEGNLAAYHDALAMAATEAEANGKFARAVSFTQRSEDDASQSQLEDSQLGHVSDESRLSHNFGSSAIAEDDGFPFDDDMDDELMIAEANAEALENDDEGFYGQEFGFYARAHNKDNVEMVNGGFFAARGSSGVKRSHSGRANFQEPSLTPITERSEWSTRNSVASLQIPGGIPGSAQSLPSPGIAQLLELDSPSFEDEMTLSALWKLRRGAFGGSSTSINSIGGGHPGSSPLAHVSSHSFAPRDHAHGLSPMSPSVHTLTTTTGIPESEEEDDDYYERPTMTQNTPRKKISNPSPTTPQDFANSPSLAAGEWKRSHSRNSSGAESVSYVRDMDGRWVLERRRTGEDGGLEIIDREYLAGARI